MRRVLIIVFLIILPWQIQAEKRGRITSAKCPYNCKTLELGVKQCKQWREGDLCFVEDLTRPANPVRKGSLKDAKIPDAVVPDANPNTMNKNRTNQKSRIPPNIIAQKQCKKINPYYIRKPQIYIAPLDNSGYSGGNFKIKGTISGNCIMEAGYYEKGERKLVLPVQTKVAYEEFNFEIKSVSRDSSEIRVIGVNNSRVIQVLDPKTLKATEEEKLKKFKKNKK